MRSGLEGLNANGTDLDNLHCCWNESASRVGSCDRILQCMSWHREAGVSGAWSRSKAFKPDGHKLSLFLFVLWLTNLELTCLFWNQYPNHNSTPDTFVLHSRIQIAWLQSLSMNMIAGFIVSCFHFYRLGRIVLNFMNNWYHVPLSYQVWDENSPWIEDYVNIAVGSVIEPVEDYSVGDVVCFTSSLLTQEGMDLGMGIRINKLIWGWVCA